MVQCSVDRTKDGRVNLRSKGSDLHHRTILGNRFVQRRCSACSSGGLTDAVGECATWYSWSETSSPPVA